MATTPNWDLPLIDTAPDADGHNPLPHLRDFEMDVDRKLGGATSGTIFPDVRYASLDAAITAIGSTVATLRITTPSFPDGANCTVPSTLTLEFTGGGSLNHTHTVTINGPVVAPLTRNIFVGSGRIILGGLISSAWFKDRAVTVPAPTSAPSLAVTTLSWEGGSWTNGTTYLIAYSYVAWNGETGLSPTASFTASTGQGIAVQIHASLANNSRYSVGGYVYASDDAGSTWHRCDGVFVSPGLVSFGDVGIYGGAPIRWNGSGAAPPVAGTTTTTKSGRTVSVPASAPTITTLCKVAATTYYPAFSYLCADGTESALSPIGSGVAITTQQMYTFAIPVEPPSGAVAVRRYLGTSATSGAMKLQDTIPLNHVRSDIHTYNSSGATPSAGTAQSTVCGLQQAIDAGMDAGGAEIYVPAGPTSTECPIILRLKNTAGTQLSGMRIRGQGGQQLFNSTAPSRIRYTGTQTGVVGILVCGSGIVWSDLDFIDPNSRVKYGIAAGDFFGGGGFNSRFYRSQFQASAAGGRGYYLPGEARSSSSHSTSEQYFESVVLAGTAWGMDIHGDQTGDFKCVNCTLYSAGDSNSGNSGYVRISSANFNMDFDGGGATGSCLYQFFLTSEANHANLLGLPSVTVKNFHTENNAVTAGPTSYVHISGLAVNTCRVALYSCSFSAFNDADNFAFYSASPVHLTLSGNERGNGNGWFNCVNTTPSASDRVTVAMLGPDNFFSVGSTWGVKANGTSPVISYDTPGMSQWIGSYALNNELGQQSQLQTNLEGDMVFAPYSGSTKLATDDAYNATTWNGNLGIPTKNAIRDKIETISTAGIIGSVLVDPTSMDVVCDPTSMEVITDG